MEFLRIHRDAVKLGKRTGRAPWDHALHDGEDHELIATLPRGSLDRVEREAMLRLEPDYGTIGRVVRGSGLVLCFDHREVEWDPSMGGFRHGA